MATRDMVKDYQRRIGQLDAAHNAALAKLEAARLRRSELLSAQDKLVADAEDAVDRAAAAMAIEVGPQLAASLLDRDVSEVRRLVKHQRSE